MKGFFRDGRLKFKPGRSWKKGLSPVDRNQPHGQQLEHGYRDREGRWTD
jgi:hypothetical protein